MFDFLPIPPTLRIHPSQHPNDIKFNYAMVSYAWQGPILGFHLGCTTTSVAMTKISWEKNKFSQGTSWIWMGRSRLLQILASIHLKSPHRGKRQISIWIKSARVWYIYSLRSIISSCKPNITNCLETSKECQSIFQENLYSCFGESFSIQCNQN